MALRPDRANERLILATGAVVIWWGRIEGLLFQNCLMIRQDPKVAARFGSEPPYVATDRLISHWAKIGRLVAAPDTELQAEISATKVELTECAEFRNTLVHGFWDYPTSEQPADQSNVTIIKPMRDGGLKFAQHTVDYQMLAKFHDRLARLYNRVLWLDLHHLAEQSAIAGPALE